MGKAQLDFPIGQKYEYNNTNYMLMALVIERVANKPFGVVMRDEIFAPAGMKNTFVHSGPGSIPKDNVPPCNNAIGYEKNDGSWVATWGLPPAFKEADHLEVGGRGDLEQSGGHGQLDTALRTNKLLKPATMKLALTGSKKNKGYGLGWQLYREDDGSLYGYGHDGYWEGFNTMYYNYLTDKHTIVLLSNRGHEIDLDKFWDKLSGLIDKHAKE
jgi:CubicO group peptidase (beta-lactamase class C family)